MEERLHGKVRQLGFTQLKKRRKPEGKLVLILLNTKGFMRMSLTSFFPALLEAKIRGNEFKLKRSFFFFICVLETI